VRLLAVSGSLRSQSTNTRLIKAASQLAPEGTTIDVSACPGRLPLFTPDIEASSVPEVNVWCGEVKAANGLILSFPEYAGGYPGALKNAFDWLVATDAHVEKPFMILSTSDRSRLARDSFTKVLCTMSGICVEEATVTVPLLGTDLSVEEILQDEELRQPLANAIQRFIAAISAG